MYSTGSLSSSAINNTGATETDTCSDAFMKQYAVSYDSDRETLKELQQFVGRNCRGDVVESKQSYCEAKKKQIVTYTKQIQKYEKCLQPTETK